MIAIDIKCDNGHIFEGWFSDSDSFKEQREKLLISCPYCGCNDVERIPSTFSIGNRSIPANSNASVNKAGDNKGKVPIPIQANLYELQEYISKHFEDVGTGFAEEALKIHLGFEEKKNIRGTTTEEEERELMEEGVPFVKIPIIKFDS
ncbi:MAG: DUF1178 family protein [Deltaproteobacteria bacterium]|uniref:DUF1178 family protein n=1 Tax=Candidatus Zymogenus saltonus TaxID=2844893 RepID=A0A9D8PN38_9DELT|nr:DUF1178 family protein [Candidatus Zymogenus saltonus]